MKKLINTALIWMALFLAPQTIQAINLEDYDYDFTEYSPENPNVLYKIKLSDVKSTDRVEIKIYWDVQMKLLKENITELNPDDSKIVVNGWNSFWIKNMPTGISYRIEIILNGQSYHRDFPTPGIKTLVAGISLLQNEKSLNLEFLYNNNSLPDTIALDLSSSKNFTNSISFDLFDFFCTKGNIEYYSANLYQIPLQAINSIMKDTIYVRLMVKSWDNYTTVEKSFAVRQQSSAISNPRILKSFAYPNPAIDKIIIHGDYPGYISIINNLGQSVMQEEIKIGINTIFLGEIPTGFYTIIKIGEGISKEKITVVR